MNHQSYESSDRSCGAGLGLGLLDLVGRVGVPGSGVGEEDPAGILQTRTTGTGTMLHTGL
jgi:hypothetical protein